MLEIIRRWGVEKRWVYGLLLGTVTLAFVGTMGWMGMSGPAGAYAAKVGGDVILIADYQRTYRNYYMNYQNAVGEVSPELADMLKGTALQSMINRLLWLEFAGEQNILVSDEELKRKLMSMEAFQTSGRFSSRRYRQVLQRIHVSPEQFESSMREDLKVQKAQDLVASGVQVTDADLLPYRELLAEQAGTEGAEDRETMIRKRVIADKRDLLLEVYARQMRQKTPIRIYQDAIDQAMP